MGGGFGARLRWAGTPHRSAAPMSSTGSRCHVRRCRNPRQSAHYPVAMARPSTSNCPPGWRTAPRCDLPARASKAPAGQRRCIWSRSTIQSHAYFRRDGDNIRLDLPIALDEAVNGAKVRVPTVEGAVVLTVAPGSSSGKTLRLKGKGMTGKKDGSRGDQLVTLEISLFPRGDEDLKPSALKAGAMAARSARASSACELTGAGGQTWWRNGRSANRQTHPRSHARRHAAVTPSGPSWRTDFNGGRDRAFSRWCAGSGSGPITMASSTPEILPIWRCWRCSPSFIVNHRRSFSA